MSRRSFLKNLALGSAAAWPLLQTSKAFGATKQRWRLALGVPKTMPIWGEGMQRFAEIVQKLSGDQLQIKVFGAGELVPALGTFDAVRSAEIQMGHSASYYWQGKIPASAFFTCVPFGMDAFGMLSWLISGDGQRLYDELMHPSGVTCLPCGTPGFQVMGWFNREINSIADLQGLKIRIPGLASQIYAKAGAKPVLLAGGEIFTSLATGVIDAVEWVGPYSDYVMGFQKAAKYLYGPGWQEPGALLELMINKQAWDSLSDQQQVAIKTASYETTLWMYSQWTSKNAEYLEKIIGEGTVQIRTLSPEVLQHLNKLSDEVVTEIASSSELAGRIYSSYLTFQRQRYSNYQNFAGNSVK